MNDEVKKGGAEELEALFPGTKVVPVKYYDQVDGTLERRTLNVPVKVFGLRQFPAILRALRPFGDTVRQLADAGSLYDAIGLVADRTEDLAALVATATEQPLDIIQRADGWDVLNLIIEVVQANADFFKQRRDLLVSVATALGMETTATSPDGPTQSSSSSSTDTEIPRLTH